jgi:hypothetical protein
VHREISCSAAIPVVLMSLRLITRSSWDLGLTDGLRSFEVHFAGQCGLPSHLDSWRGLVIKSNTGSPISLLLCGITNGATRRQISQRLDQDVRGKWLNKKSDATDFHGAPSDRFIIIRTHEYDGDGEARI